ncbi:SAP domain-containing protein [Ligilactobacillus sp. WILCCON 0076]|uniref:SAP domain-containing protein n=1 Tax=Ligilactobacillus ubinensis TaxID=2876789 RepID=A0A9X2JKF7_9LACO|nr:SAP domain-containing protein [Ligilactobacillus ubinensis]MCP0886049.1 SAP domain-containing protein [Ligilactobacillus ubinensis]
MDDEYSINCNQELKNEQVIIPSSLEEFQSKYYYKQDLVKICRRLALPTSGTKAKLNHYLTLYLSGTPSSQIKKQCKKVKHATLTYEQINLDTKVVGSGFAFNDVARQFFADYFGVKKFSFKKTNGNC